MNHILTLKHWQIFILFCLLPFMAQILISLLVLSPTLSMLLSSWFFTCSSGGFALWLWLTTIQLSAALPDGRRRWSKGLVLCITLLPFCFLLWTSLTTTQAYAATGGKAIQLYKSDTSWLSSVLFFSAVVGMVSSLSILVRLLLLNECRNKKDIMDHLGAFLLLCIFPIGIWFIQPRINKVAAAMQTDDLDMFTVKPD